MTLRMIQPIGKKPVTIPSREARVARPTGMPKATTAMAKARIRARTAATWALTRPLAIMASSAITGTEAASVDSHGLPNGS